LQIEYLRIIAAGMIQRWATRRYELPFGNYWNTKGL